MSDIGIDYGMGQSNIDKETGIRYGVIHQNEVLTAWCEGSEPEYGEPHCPKCGNEAVAGDSDGGPVDDDGELIDRDEAGYETLHHACGDYACDSCKILFDGEHAFGDEPLGFTFKDSEYKAESGSDGDIFILKSPYYTRCQFCSPCAPGAGYIMNEVEDGVKAYCFGHDWFDDNKAPYTVYRVSNNEEVQP